MSPEPASTTDAQEIVLMRAVARGDEQAFAAIYDRYNAVVFGLLMRILNSRAEAEDVLQEVFLQAWQRAASYDESRGRPFTWLVTLARSRAIDRLRLTNARERAAAANFAELDFDSAVVDAVEETMRSERGEVVRRALAAIPDEQRKPLLLAYAEGLTQTEIAARLNEPLGTVKTRMRSGMSKLRELLRTQAGDMLTG